MDPSGHPAPVLGTGVAAGFKVCADQDVGGHEALFFDQWEETGKAALGVAAVIGGLAGYGYVVDVAFPKTRRCNPAELGPGL